MSELDVIKRHADMYIDSYILNRKKRINNKNKFRNEDEDKIERKAKKVLGKKNPEKRGKLAI